MPRPSTKTASTSRSSSKRPAQASPTRQSKRARAIARKSYVEPDTDGEDASSDAGASDYKGPSDNSAAADSDLDEAVSDEEVYVKKGPSKGDSAKEKSLPLHKKHQTDDQELWKPGAKLAPGTQLIIKKPKAREAGETPYTDDTIHPNTMLFLRDLAANNERQWLKSKRGFFDIILTWLVEMFGFRTSRLTLSHTVHDPDYRAALQDFNTFVENLSEKVVEADETIPELPVKDIVSNKLRSPNKTRNS